MKGFALLALALALEGGFLFSIATPPAPGAVARREAACGGDEPQVTVMLPEIVVRVPPLPDPRADLHARLPVPLHRIAQQ
jgi:hypothetical protein